MSENTNNNVKMSVFILVITLFIAVMGVIWTKLEKIDDTTGEIRVEVARIKDRIGGFNISVSNNSLLNRMFNTK